MHYAIGSKYQPEAAEHSCTPRLRLPVSAHIDLRQTSMPVIKGLSNESQHAQHVAAAALISMQMAN